VPLIDWSADVDKRIVIVVDVTYTPSGGGSEVLRWCWRATAPDGWADVETGEMYLPYLDSWSWEESWASDFVAGPIPVPSARWKASLPDAEIDPDVWEAVMTGHFRGQAVVLTAVELDDDGREVARTELFRGVASDRGAGEAKYPISGRGEVSWSAEAFGGLLSTTLSLDAWEIPHSAGDYSGQSDFNGMLIPRIYGLNEDVDVGRDKGGWWVQMPVVDSSASSVTIGMCGHEVDNNPVDGGELGTDNNTARSGWAFVDDALSAVAWLGTGNYSNTASYPQLVTSYSARGSDAFVMDFGVAFTTKGKRFWAKPHGQGSVTAVANTLEHVEDIVSDLLTFQGAAADFWVSGWPAAVASTFPDDERKCVVVVPGIRPSSEAPKMSVLLGELLHPFGLHLTLEPDSSNDNELRAVLRYRQVTGTADHRFSIRSGQIAAWSYKTDWQNARSSVRLRSAEYVSPIVVDTKDNEVLPRYDVFGDTDATAEANDTISTVLDLDFQWLRSANTASWDAIGETALAHCSGVIHTVSADLGIHGLGVRLGEEVEWDVPIAQHLSGGAVGVCWGRRCSGGAGGSIRVALLTRHGSFTYPT